MFGLTEFLICSTVAIFIGLYRYSVYINSYWKRNKIPSVSAKPFVGNLLNALLLRKSVSEVYSDIYNDQATADKPFVGIHIFHKPTLFVKDPELIKHILVKDFSSFNNRNIASDMHSDVVGSANLFSMRNPAWKVLRSRLTPFFTSGKMKQMFHLMKNVGNEMDEFLLSHKVNEKQGSFSTEIKEIMAGFTTDANSLKNPENEFRKNGSY